MKRYLLGMKDHRKYTDLIQVNFPGDKFDPFCAEEQACKVVNPGSFCKTDFSFKTYIPATRELEDSQVPGD